MKKTNKVTSKVSVLVRGPVWRTSISRLSPSIAYEAARARNSRIAVLREDVMRYLVDYREMIR